MEGDYVSRQSSLPLVSAIIPTQNRPEMLIRAINSVTRQTYRPIEIIVVDDGSACDIENQIRENPEIQGCRVIKNTRKPGAAGARNTGFYESRGAFVGFLDDDDEWLPEKISKQIEAFQKSDNRVGIVCTHDILIHNNIRHIRRRYLEGKMYEALCREHIAGNTSNPLIRRYVLEEVGLFDEALPAGQDTDLWIRIARQYLFTTVNEPLVLVHQGSPWRITTNSYKQLQGLSALLQKHWHEFSVRRRCKLMKRIVREALTVAKERWFRG